eukprot:scaffold13918_cov122-Isochrysis_galbana.AAC.2
MCAGVDWLLKRKVRVLLLIKYPPRPPPASYYSTTTDGTHFEVLFFQWDPLRSFCFMRFAQSPVDFCDLRRRSMADDHGSRSGAQKRASDSKARSRKVSLCAPTGFSVQGVAAEFSFEGGETPLDQFTVKK